MKKKILLLIGILLLTGCSTVSYNLEINLNSNNEKIYFEGVTGSNIEQRLNLALKQNQNFSGENIEYNTSGSYVEIFNSFEDISNLNIYPTISMIYNHSEIIKNGNITNIRLTDYNNSMFVCGEYAENCSEVVVKNLIVNIISEYKIISNNADVVNESENKYTWYFNGTPKEILYFSYSDEIRWDIVIKNFIKNNLNTIVLVSILVGTLIAGLVFLGIFLKKMKANND